MLFNFIQRRTKTVPGDEPPEEPEYFTIPSGSEIYWWGKANEIPADFSVVSIANDMYIRGVTSGASDSKLGDKTHVHGYDKPTGNSGAHTHTFSFSGLSASSGVEYLYPTANYNAANNGHTHGGGSGKTSSAGDHNHAISGNTGSTEISPPHVRLYLIKATKELEMPINGVFMWRGTVAGRPSGTSICDGTNGKTPDMRNRFVKATSSDSNVKNTGGSSTHSHSGPNLVASGKHRHSVNVWSGGTSNNTKNASGYGHGTTVAAGGHAHSVGGNLNYEENHIHATGNTASTASLPEFYALYFVMRTM